MDTSSGRFCGQWAFLSDPPQHGRSRSIPTSSYLQSNTSSASPFPLAHQSHSLNTSRTSLLRNFNPSSIGGYTPTIIPSQPVLLRVHSAEASAHLNPVPRSARRRVPMSTGDELPPIHEFSIDGILAAIEEDIEDDINAIAGILGRSRLAPADHRDSHLLPQGTIRGTTSSLQVVEEGGGSNSGSAACSLRENLRAIPRLGQLTDEALPSSLAPRPLTPLRNKTSPAVSTGPLSELDQVASHQRLALQDLIRSQYHGGIGPLPVRIVTNARVSETYLLAGANGTTISDPPVVHEGDRYYPLYSYDERDIFDIPPTTIEVPVSLTERLHRLDFLSEMRQFFLNKKAGKQGTGVRESKAELHLRRILGQQPSSQPVVMLNTVAVEAQDLYE